MFTEQNVYELRYRQYKHEIYKMRCNRNKFMVKYQVLESKMGQNTNVCTPLKMGIILFNFNSWPF